MEITSFRITRLITPRKSNTHTIALLPQPRKKVQGSPSRGNAAMIGTPEAVLRASPLRTVQRILIAVVAAIVVTVAQPVRLDADIRLLALEMIGRAGRVARASLVRLVARYVVLAVVHPVADLRHGYAALVGAGKLARRAGPIDAALLVRAVLAVVLVVALPRLEDAAAVVAAELVCAARVVGCWGFLFRKITLSKDGK